MPLVSWRNSSKLQQRDRDNLDIEFSQLRFIRKLGKGAGGTVWLMRHDPTLKPVRTHACMPGVDEGMWDMRFGLGGGEEDQCGHGRQARAARVGA